MLNRYLAAGIAAVALTGIADLLTANPEAGETVNINAASKRVLMTLPGIDSTLADAIISEREKGGRQGLTGSAQISEDYFFTDVNNLFLKRDLTPQ